MRPWLPEKKHEAGPGGRQVMQSPVYPASLFRHGPQPSSIGMTWELLEMQSLGPWHRPTKLGLHGNIYSQDKIQWEVTEELPAREWHNHMCLLQRSPWSQNDKLMDKTKDCLWSCFRIQERNTKGLKQSRAVLENSNWLARYKSEGKVNQDDC
jgi:hypothetical protein